MKKKTDVHMVQHTHWDREWYFTSDDSRTMLYYDMKFVVDYLGKNEDKFTFDGQSSVIDDFLQYSPEWKEKMKRVVRDKKLFVGPFYTQCNATLPHGEAIVRNIEIGKKIAEDLGHSMEVGYLPDTFGHNNQMPQILKLNDLNNISFYRGLDPEDTNDKLYFHYQGQDGTKVLGHWQTHYSTKGEAFEYTAEAFDKHVVADYDKKGQFHPSVKSYVKRSFGLPVAIPVGTDQLPFRKEVRDILKVLNQKHEEFNFVVSDYETALKLVAKEIKEKNISLPVVTGELRQALTGRVHRSNLATRQDIKQIQYELEDKLINVVEPLSIMSLLNNVDVPWKMIEKVWKDVFKSSAHDSYGATNEDHVNSKLKARVTNALRVANDIIAMVSRIFASQITNEKNDAYKKLVIFNFSERPYSGLYEINTTVKAGYDEGKFKIVDKGEELKYAILERDNLGTHERDALRLLFSAANVPAFGYKVLDIEYLDHKNYVTNKNNKISNDFWGVQVLKNDLLISKSDQKLPDLFNLVMDPSVGDTYDHSPLTFSDKKYILNNFEVLETCQKSNTIKFKASAKVPSTISKWKTNETSVVQEATIQITLVQDKLHLKIFTTNKSLNGRMLLLTNTFSQSGSWYHDQQFGIYRRELHNKYMQDWEQPNKLGYKWDEYPTNLSPFQRFISNSEATFTVYANGTREHEMIEWNNKKHFAITLYRAFDVFGKEKFTYRPGRASGARCLGPDNQLLNQELQFTFILDYNKTTVQDQFVFAKNLDAKNYYIPAQWGLARTLLRWKTNIAYFDSDKNGRNNQLLLPKFVQNNKQIILSSIYRDPQNRVIARFLNVGDKIRIKKEENFKISRTLSGFTSKDVELQKFSLVNVLVKEL